MTLQKRIFKHRILYLFILPAVIWFVIFCYVPMYGVLIAFKEYKFNLGTIGSPWVGFKYFAEFLTAPEFWLVMKNTVVISLLKIIFGFPAPIILALLLNEIYHLRYKRVIQTISYLPYFVSWVVVATVLLALFSPYSGLVNNIRRSWFDLEPIFFLGEQAYFYPLIVISDIWKGVGWGSIIYLAAIAGVSDELYEAAYLDGAGKLQSCWYVTLPSIRPTIGIMFIFAVGGILNAGFDQILLLQQPSNMDVSDIIDTYVLRRGITQGNFGYATAVGLFKSAIAFFFIYFTNYFARKKLETSLW